jgi:hypothetical protein
MIGNGYKIELTWDAEIVQSHAIKIRVDMTVSNPPHQRVFNILDSFAQILFNLACPSSDMIGHRYVREGSEIIVVNLRDYN